MNTNESPENAPNDSKKPPDSPVASAEVGGNILPAAKAPKLTLIPDAPITGPNLDRLDRMAFVRSFAQAIRAAQGTDSIVLALAGPWGSGKSSLLNLVVSELNSTETDTPPLLVRFNPWWFTGSGQLVAAFLQQLGAAMGRPAVKDILGEATEGLEYLADALVSPGVKKDYGEQFSRDIQILREKVMSIFQKSDRRILIFMDDIVRLSPEEMAQLLLIVRAIADFPNTTYVLSFDYDVVVEAMANKLGVDGRVYLEKVVQLQIDVPVPRRMTLERMVVAQLSSIDPEAANLDDEAKTHFRLLFEGGIKHFLSTPRACTRLLNVLRFIYPTLKGQVYYPDLLGLATLMAFSSQAIHAMRSFSDAFYGHCDEKGKGWGELKMFHERWLAQLSARDQPAVESLVRTLFPKASWALDGPMRGEDCLAKWDEQKRICSPKHFDSYFRLGLSAGEAAEYQWQNMVELLDDATSFAKALEQYGPIGDERAVEWLGELLQQASDFVNERASSDQASKLFMAIIKRGDQIALVQDFDEENVLIEPIHWVVSLLRDCLRRIETSSERIAVLKKAMSAQPGLWTACELLDQLEHQIELFSGSGSVQTQDGEASFGAAERVESAPLSGVFKALDESLISASNDSTLRNHPNFMRIAQKWFQFGNLAESIEWVRGICKEDQVFVEVLLQLGEHLVDLEDGTDRSMEFPIEVLDSFFERKELNLRARKLLKDAPIWLSIEGESILDMLTSALLRPIKNGQ